LHRSYPPIENKTIKNLYCRNLVDRDKDAKKSFNFK